MKINETIQIIAEGSTRWDYFIKRWGLSILIGEDVLFDTFGDPIYLIRKMKEKRIDIGKIKHIILSHEHWDHMNGLWPILAINPNLIVYLGTHFSQIFKTRVKNICQKMVEIDKPVHICRGIYTTQELRATYNSRVLYESGLVIKTETGVTLITGCAHPGIIVMLQHVKSQFKQPIQQLIGGFHLKELPQFTVDDVIKKLQGEKIPAIFACHCTGKKNAKLLNNNFVMNL